MTEIPPNPPVPPVAPAPVEPESPAKLEASVRGSIDEQIKKHPVIIFLGALFTGFLSGLGAYQGVLTASHLEVVKQRSSCGKDQVALRVETFPPTANVELVGTSQKYFFGTCLAKGRYEVLASAPGYSSVGQIIQLGEADHYAILSLDKVQTIELTGTKVGKYKGERLTFSFNDVQLRAVLQVMGDFTGNKFLMDESVVGTVNIKLKDVPWDQAFDVLAISHNLEITNIGPNRYVVTSRNGSQR